MSPVTVRDVRVILTEPEPGARYTIVRVDTSEPGLHGYGDASLRTRPLAVKSAVEDYLRPFLIGKSVEDIEDLWQSAYASSYWRNGPVLNNALGGVDEALWDIKGKMAGMPVYQVLGGRAREAAAVYVHAVGRDNAEVEEQVRAYLERGFHHVRVQVETPGYATYSIAGSGGDGGAGGGRQRVTTWDVPADERFAYAQRAGIFEPRPYMRSVVALLEHVRSRVGWDVELLHDAHERLPPVLAVEFAKDLEAYKLFFLEDLFAPADLEWFRMLRQQCATPLAVGEILNNPAEILPLLRERLVDFIRLRVAHVGGITPARKYAATAEMFGVRTAWQGPANVSPVGQAAHLALDLHCWNFGIQESPDHRPRVAEVFPGTPEVRDGYMWPNGRPGLGVEVDEAMAARFPHSDTPGNMFDNVRRADGTSVRP